MNNEEVLRGLAWVKGSEQNPYLWHEWLELVYGEDPPTLDHVSSFPGTPKGGRHFVLSEGGDVMVWSGSEQQWV